MSDLRAFDKNDGFDGSRIWEWNCWAFSIIGVFDCTVSDRAREAELRFGVATSDAGMAPDPGSTEPAIEWCASTKGRERL